MDVSISGQELLDDITNGKKPIFYNSEKLAYSVDLANAGAKPKFLKHEFGMFFENEDSDAPLTCFSGTTLKIPSISLYNHMKDCEKAVLFCATLGHIADRRIETAKVNDVELAVLLDNAFLLIIEKLCDSICEDVKEKYADEGYAPTPRFSLGYGDSPLALQSDFLKLLNAESRLGILVTEGGMMIPSKTVTAMIGLKKI